MKTQQGHNVSEKWDYIFVSYTTYIRDFIQESDSWKF